MPLTDAPMPQTILLASDHAAIELKAALADWLRAEGHEVRDLGPETADRVDYPDYGYKLATAVAADDTAVGIALCGSGIGISIAVNRVAGCRCALVNEPLSAALAREHNDANVGALGARMHDEATALHLADIFVSTPFSGVERHARRIAKLASYEASGIVPPLT